MGKPSLNIERSHPAFAENHKKNSKKTRTRAAKKIKVTVHQLEDKEQTKKDRKNKAKIIDKSRQTKRKLKSFESGHRTPDQEWDAHDTVMNMELVMTYEEMYKNSSFWNEDW